MRNRLLPNNSNTPTRSRGNNDECPSEINANHQNAKCAYKYHEVRDYKFPTIAKHEAKCYQKKAHFKKR